MAPVLLSKMPAKISLARRSLDSPSVFKAVLALALFLGAALSGMRAFSADLRPEEIVTVLPKDAIPAILSPSFDGGHKASWLKTKDAVVGVEIGGDSRAYPFSALSREPVVNDAFQGLPLLVVFDPDTATGVILKRKIEGKTLSFKKTQSPDKKGVFLADDTTGSLWEGLTGRAVQGALKGRTLEPVPATPSFWFGWVDHYPNTELYYAKK